MEAPGPKSELPVIEIVQGKLKELEMFKKLAGLTALAGLFFASTASAQITGTAHDFSAEGWAGGEICIVCHTAHTGDTTVADAPLWNHELSAVATYTLYAGFDLQGTVGQPASSSKLCLSCHDGTVAIDSFGGVTGGTTIAASADFGTDLSDDHPISIDYNVADTGLNAPSSASGITGGTTIAADMLVGGTDVECSSCHDVHNQYGEASLLVKDNAASALCLTCHNK